MFIFSNEIVTGICTQKCNPFDSPVVLSDLWKDSSFRKVDFSARARFERFSKNSHFFIDYRYLSKLMLLVPQRILSASTKARAFAACEMLSNFLLPKKSVRIWKAQGLANTTKTWKIADSPTPPFIGSPTYLGYLTHRLRACAVKTHAH